MENAYLTMTIGPVLAKAVAETVVAQPSNPQEFLALYLLHHLQQEQRKLEAASQKAKAEVLREDWVRERGREEKMAVDTIQRVFQNYKGRLQAKKAREVDLQETYDEAEAEAQELLDQLDEDGGEGSGAAASGEGGEGGADEEEAAPTGEANLEELQEALDEAKTNFYLSQRFMLKLSKTDFGALKGSLMNKKDRIRVAQDAVKSLVDVVALEEEGIEDIEFDPQHRQPNFSPAAALLADHIHGRKDHSRISVAYMNFSVLRAMCYLLFNATPKAVDTPAKVANMLKPTVAVQLLRAFDPCGTYDKSKPLDLEKRLPREEGGEEEKEEGEDEGESVPVPQPKTRQVRRVQRLFRSLLLDREYICEIDPSKFFDDDVMEEDEALQKEQEAYEAGAERAASIRQSVESQTKQRGGVVLWALLVFLRNAVAYRSARDEWVRVRREKGLDVPESHEMPEEEEEDDQNEEALVDDEGETDWPAVRRLQEKLGVDADEQLAKLWEAKDARRRKELRSRAEALKKMAEADEEEEAEDDVE
eukprot:gene7854-5481_t